MFEEVDIGVISKKFWGEDRVFCKVEDLSFSGNQLFEAKNFAQYDLQIDIKIFF